jgi:hypothetical protein
MTGITAFLKPWPQMTRRSLRPLARAVRMKSDRETSSMAARCMNEMYATSINPSVRAGRMSVLRLSQLDGMMPSTVGPTPPMGTQPS